jgi:tRNA (adenine37-N6)-methyltransferase
MPSQKSPNEGSFSFKPIGRIFTPFTEKFGVPRQSLMVSEARGVLKLNPDPDFRLALTRLEDFSHLWVVFVFDKHIEKGWRPTIRPPRVDAPRKIGVFASRSPHRPNPIGLSVVKLDRIDWDAREGIEIHLSGVDFLNDTAVLDIKPYIPYADRVIEATGGWAEGDIPRYPVSFSEKSREQISRIVDQEYPHFQKLLTELIQFDPRPTSQKRTHAIEQIESEGLKYGFNLLDYDVKWEIRSAGIHITELVRGQERQSKKNVKK